MLGVKPAAGRLFNSNEDDRVYMGHPVVTLSYDYWVNRFNRDPKIPIFLLSLKAGGTGLNLTGADTVIHYDQWWNPMVEDQATDRTHRIGQTRQVTALKLIVRNTIEEKIHALQQRKRVLFNQMMAGAPGRAGELTREDVEFLLGDGDAPHP